MQFFSRFFMQVLFTALIFCLPAWAASVAPLTAEKTKAIATLFTDAIKAHAFPGACVIAGTKNQILLDRCFGYFTYDKKTPVTNTHLFDLASMTKVIATTSAIMKLYEQGKIDLDAPITRYLPQFTGPTPLQTQVKAKITVRHLLTHTASLPDKSYSNQWQAIYQAPLFANPATRTVYSDVGFFILGQIVAEITQQPLNRFVQQNIFEPLQMNDTLFSPLQRYNQSRIVPSSFFPKTKILMQGTVNDPMARRFNDIVGNAGLFSTPSDLAHFAQMMLNQGTWQDKHIFNAATVALFTQRANLTPRSSFALGWDTALGGTSKRDNCKWHQFSAGQYIAPTAFGHTGYTGTAIWISPAQDFFVILLTNRVTPFALSDNHRTDIYWRQKITSAIWQAFGFTQKNHLCAEQLPKT